MAPISRSVASSGYQKLPQHADFGYDEVAVKKTNPHPPPASTPLLTKSPAPAARSPFDGGAPRWTVPAAVAIAIAGLAAFGNSLDGAFVFEDGPAVVANETIRRLSPLSEVLSPPVDSAVAGRPLVNLTLALNYAWAGLDVRPYHAVNLAIHLAAALTLFGLVRRTLSLPVWRGRFDAAAPVLAIAVALLWAVHPLQTASVSYVGGRTETLLGLCFLLTLYCYVRGATSARWLPWHLAAVVACALGMASDVGMVAAPLVALLYDRAFLSGTFGDALRRRWPLWAALAATWIVLAAVAVRSDGQSIAAVEGHAASGWDYLRSQPEYIVRYVRLCFWPRPLVFDYGTQPLAATWRSVVSGLFVLALVVGSVWMSRRRPWLGFLGLAFCLLLLPSSIVASTAGQVAAEHRMYLPLAVVATLCVLAAYFAFARLLSGESLDDEIRSLVWKVVPALLLAGVAVGLAYLARHRNRDYRSPFALWQSTAASWPSNARAHRTLGQEWLKFDRYREAQESFATSVRLDPQHPDGYIGLGDLDRKLDRGRTALENYTQAIRLRPDSSDAYYRRGLAQAMSGRSEAAVADFNRALELAPRRGDVYASRGAVYSALEKHDLAIADFDEAVRASRREPTVYFGRGNAYAAAGQFQSAIDDFTRAIELQPEYVAAYIDRAANRWKLGQTAEALLDYTRAIGLQPSFVPVYYSRALLLTAVGRNAEALADIEYALELDPNYADGYRRRAAVKYRLGDFDGAWADVAAFRSRGGTPDDQFIESLSKASGRSE